MSVVWRCVICEEEKKQGEAVFIYHGTDRCVCKPCAPNVPKWITTTLAQEETEMVPHLPVEYHVEGFGKVKVQSFFLEEDDRDPFLPITLTLVKGIGIERWAIFDGMGSVLSKTPTAHGKYLFHLPNLPSDRDDDYYQEYRFESAQAGYEFWRENRSEICATQLEKITYHDKLKGDGLIE